MVLSLHLHFPPHALYVHNYDLSLPFSTWQSCVCSGREHSSEDAPTNCFFARSYQPQFNLCQVFSSLRLLFIWRKLFIQIALPLIWGFPPFLWVPFYLAFKFPFNHLISLSISVHLPLLPRK